MFRVLLAAILPLTTALQWTDSLTNNTQMTIDCSNDVHLSWNFSLSPDERLEDIKWIFQPEDGSDILMALFAAGQFETMPAFSGRLQWTGQAGILVSRSGLADSGNYSVVVNVVENSQGHLSSTSSKSVSVRVAAQDPPATESGGMHVQQRSEAVYDNTTGQWRVMLTCGIFTSLGQPAVDVVWTTPEGKTVNSSSEANGTFHLLLPNPPSGETTPALSLHSHQPHAVSRRSPRC